MPMVMVSVINLVVLPPVGCCTIIVLETVSIVFKSFTVEFLAYEENGVPYEKIFAKMRETYLTMSDTNQA